MLTSRKVTKSLCLMVSLVLFSNVIIEPSLITFARPTNKYKVSPKVSGEDPLKQCQRSCGNEYAAIDEFLNENPKESKKRQELLSRMVNILGELGEYRNNFLRTSNLKELFPAAYFHTTKNELDKIVAREMESPIDKMEMMIAFYDAYKANRVAYESGKRSEIERHWQSYYDAVSVGNDFIEQKSPTLNELLLNSSLQIVLGAGIDAHVEYDLPRAIRYVAVDSKGGKGQTKEILRADFEKTDSIFSETQDLASKDIINSLYPGFTSDKINSLAAILGTKLLGSSMQSKVIKMRYEAWDLAFSGKRLPTLFPQPVIPHSAESSLLNCESSQETTQFSIANRLKTNIVVCKGDKIKTTASGRVWLGPWVQYSSPNGIAGLFLASAYNYDEIRNTNHGALVMLLVDPINRSFKYAQIGEDWERVSEDDAILAFIINDKHNSNNRGEYSVNVTITKYRMREKVNPK